MSRITGSTPIKIDERVALALSWCGANGLQFARKQDSANIHVPITLQPTPFPRSEYVRALRIQSDFNLLFHRVAQDSEFLSSSLSGVLDSDPFTKNCFDIYKQVLQKNGPARYTFGIYRSDYMLHESGDGQAPAIKQIEFNTISSSFAAHSENTARLHKFLLERLPMEGLDPLNIPQPSNLNEIVDVFAEAVKLYAKNHSRVETKGSLGVLIIVQPKEGNEFDQRLVEFRAWERHGIPFFRRTLAEVHESCVVAEDGSLWIDGTEIAVVYYRAGYTPNDYPSQLEWDARLMLESSPCVLCPDVAGQLAGCKKIQQVLAQPGILERYVDDDQARRLRATFAGLYSMGSSEEGRDEEAVARAIANPENFVLKPQREGGGNNIYDDDLKKVLRTKDELHDFILMDIIRPPIHRNILIKEGLHFHTPTLSELGIFGVFLSDKESVLVNRAIGHLLRTKDASSREGGVAAGFAALDSPILY